MISVASSSPSMQQASKKPCGLAAAALHIQAFAWGALWAPATKDCSPWPAFHTLLALPALPAPQRPARPPLPACSLPQPASLSTPHRLQPLGGPFSDFLQHHSARERQPRAARAGRRDGSAAQQAPTPPGAAGAQPDGIGGRLEARTVRAGAAARACSCRRHARLSPSRRPLPPRPGAVVKACLQLWGGHSSC